MSKLFRVILPVTDIEAAAAFYQAVFGFPGKRVSPGRHYFNCDGTILACYDPIADGDQERIAPNPEHIYFATDILEAVFERCKRAGCLELDSDIHTQPWGERSFYGKDPFGNRFCFVDSATVFTGEDN